MDNWLDEIAAADVDEVLPPASWDWSQIDKQLQERYISHLCGIGTPDVKTNARIKLYLHTVTLQCCNQPIFPTAEWEPMDGPKKVRDYAVPPKGHAADPERAAEESRRRAKSKVRDIALCNHFTHMVTWTLDPKKVDRYDPVAVYKKVRPFLSNMTQRKDFRYVIIPEYHALKPGEDKPAIHFHGLCSLGSVQIVRSMKRKRPRTDKHGRPVYNMTDWDLGWSTVVPLDENYEKAVNYVTKYISKQETKILGKYYLSSRSLRKSPDIVPIDSGMDYDDFVDSDKLNSGEQFVSTVFRDVKICSEEFDRSVWDD